MRLIRFRLVYFFRLLRFYFRAHTKYDVHSPFVADFLSKTLEDNRWFYAFSTVEVLRKQLLQNRSVLTIKDFGAGSAVFATDQRPVRDLVRYTAISPRLGRLLFRIVCWHRPKTLLEMGTSLGISALYQGAAALKSKMITLEGAAPLAQLAKHHLAAAKLQNVTVVEGDFKTTLPKALQQLGQLDYLYLDGDHRGDHTLDYFNQCLKYAHENSLFIIGDIHWSADMENAWNTLRQDSRVSLSIDLFDFGLLFFRKENKEKQHFTLVPAKWKMWRMGFF